MMGVNGMKNSAAVMVTIYASFLVSAVLSGSLEFVLDNPTKSDISASGAAISRAYSGVEEQYSFENRTEYSVQFYRPEVMPSPIPTLTQMPDPTSAPTPTATPEAEMTPTSTPTQKPTLALSPAPTATPMPKPAVTLSPEQIASMTPDELEIAILANRILNNPNITLTSFHPSGVSDKAFAYNNIYDASQGREAQRSRYGTAPGGSVYLSARMLETILLLADKYTFTITEIAGASHSSGSTHYKGIAFDVGTINGKYATRSATARAFVADAAKLGATFTLIESTCVHIDFQ